MTYKPPHERKVDRAVEQRFSETTTAKRLLQQKADVADALARLRLLHASGQLELNYLELIEKHHLPAPPVYYDNKRKREKLRLDFIKHGYIDSADYGLPRLRYSDDYIEIKAVKEGFLSGYDEGVYTFGEMNYRTHTVFVTLDDQMYPDPNLVGDNVYAAISCAPSQVSSAPSELSSNILNNIIRIEDAKHVPPHWR